MLIGARRVGKTVLMTQLADSFDGSTLLLNGDDLSTAELLNDRRVASYKRWLGNTELLLIDEAQVIPDVGRSLKLLIDSFPSLTIFATGSSSFDLANRGGEPLVGRMLTHTLYPLAQLELLVTETYLQTRDRLTDRLIFGSYPDVVQMEETNGQLSAFEMKWNTNRVRFPKAFQTAYPDASLSVVNPDNYLDFIT